LQIELFSIAVRIETFFSVPDFFWAIYSQPNLFHFGGSLGGGGKGIQWVIVEIPVHPQLGGQSLKCSPHQKTTKNP